MDCRVWPEDEARWAPSVAIAQNGAGRGFMTKTTLTAEAFLAAL